jgi:hypothetical protein
MSVLNNLPKELVRSAVRQVGRDGGKVISNKIYKGKHGTPIYNSGQNDGGTSKKIVDVSEIDMSIQPPVKGGGIIPVLKGLLCQVIPILGHVTVLVRGLIYLNQKTTNIYASVPNKVADRRYKEGYRIDGYSIVETKAVRNLQPYELKKIKGRGISYIASLILGILIVFSLANFLPEEENEEEAVKYGYVEKSSINVRQEPSTQSGAILQVGQGDSVKIIDSKGPLETINGKSSNWVKIEYAGKNGWIWGGLLNFKK